MKKIFILILSLIVTTLTACGENTEAAFNQVPTTKDNSIEINFTNTPSSDSELITVNSFHNEEYKMNIEYPCTSYSQLNEITEDLVYGCIEQQKQTMNDGSELSISYETVKFTDYLLGFKFNIHTKTSTEETSVIKTLTFDLENGKNILLEDIFEDNIDYIELITKKLPLNILAHNPILTKSKLSNFIIDQSNLNIYFEANQFENSIENVSISLDSIYNKLSNFFKNNMEEQKKLIALTFDDGPNPLTTPVLLDGLAQRDVKATFFMLGMCIEKNIDIVKRMYNEGHGIGNHSYGHKKLTSLDEMGIKEQYNRPNEILNSIINTDSTLFRPPYGSVNDCVKSIVDVPIILWDIDPYDWKYKDADVISEHIINKAEDGDIILLHDIYSTSVEAAFKVIDALKEKGFKFVTVDELIRRNNVQPEASQVFRFERKNENS